MDTEAPNVRPLHHLWPVLLALFFTTLLPQLLTIPAFVVGLRDSPEGYSTARIMGFSLKLLYITAGPLLILGLPAFYYLHIKDKFRWVTAVSTGYTIGLLCAAAWSLADLYVVGFSEFPWGFHALKIGYFSGQGFLLGGTFWGVWRLMRRLSPDS